LFCKSICDWDIASVALGIVASYAISYPFN